MDGCFSKHPNLVLKQTQIFLPGYFLFYYWGGQITTHEFKILRIDGFDYPQTHAEANSFSTKDALVQIEKYNDKYFKVFHTLAVAKHVRNLWYVPGSNNQKI